MCEIQRAEITLVKLVQQMEFNSEIKDLSCKGMVNPQIGRPITAIAEPSLTEVSDNRLKVWQKQTKIVQHIWKRWSNNYLSTLQNRNKWYFEKNNVKIHDMVILKEDNLPVCNWPLGRILEVYHGTPIDADLREQILIWDHTNQKVISKKMRKEGAFHHLIIVSYPRQDKRSKVNGCVIQHDFMLLTVRINDTSLGFIEAADQTAKSLESDVLNFLNTLDINLAKCRGQGYDGAANMRGTYGGLQKLIKDKQPRANYVHCSTHNLNLVLNDACNNELHVREFYDL
ncbi:integrase catalytic domain-containing protein [Trichonephila clavipes]|nr:integrase catalytic domain-containing protein [Trichonephila clavipes]